MDDCRVFGDWLKVMEAEISDASPDQSNVTVTKEEFRRCEVSHKSFGDWLKVMEAEISDASPDQSNVTVTKEEFRRCEVCHESFFELLCHLTSKWNGSLPHFVRGGSRVSRKGV